MTFYSDHEHEAPNQTAPCEYEIPLSGGGTRVCGADWSSVLHPPDQYRHWCSALEAGGDCVHEEIAATRAEGGAMDVAELEEFEALVEGRHEP